MFSAPGGNSNLHNMPGLQSQIPGMQAPGGRVTFSPSSNRQQLGTPPPDGSGSPRGQPAQTNSERALPGINPLGVNPIGGERNYKPSHFGIWSSDKPNGK